MVPVAIAAAAAGDRIEVTSPFHPDMVAAAKRLNGKWTGTRWIFDARDEDRIREVLREIYGTDGTPGQTVDVRLDVKTWYHQDDAGDARTIYFAGREIAHRPSRDARVRLGDGVVLVEGSFTSSGGSVKNPRLGVEDVTTIVVEVRDVPATHHHVVNSSPAEHGVTVLNCLVDVEALTAERDALLARVAEIDKLLAEDEGGTPTI